MSSFPGKHLRRWLSFPWLAFVKNLLKARKGRPTALLVLVVLSVFKFAGEWPNDVARPAFISALEALTPDSFKTPRKLLFDQYQRRFPRTPQAEPVTIVAIDENALASLGQWPWPRNRLAALVDAIAAMKPLAIGLDIYMPEPDQTSPDKVAANLPKSAAALAAGLRALPSHETVLANSLRMTRTILGAAGFDYPAYTTTTELLTTPVIVHGPDPGAHVHRYTHVLASLPELQQASSGQAILSVDLDQGVVRNVPVVVGLGNKLVPCLPLEMLRAATDSSAIEVYSDATGVKAVGVADVQVATDPGGDIWPHFAPLRSMLHRYVSARDLMAGKVPLDRIQDKLVLVGLTGAGLTDMRTTALGELVPGIEIQAQVIEAIFEGDLLQRPAWIKWSESAFILVFGLLLIWYIPRTDSRLAVFMSAVPKASAVLGIALNLLLLSCSVLVFREFGLLVDAASIFIILSAVMGCFFSTGLLHADGGHERNAASGGEALQRCAGKAN